MSEPSAVSLNDAQESGGDALLRLLHALRRPMDAAIEISRTGAPREPQVVQLAPAVVERHRGLLLAEAVVRRTSAAQSSLRHAAIIGPTQTGKSSVVNALLGTEVAKVSPLAGFTVHPQAFLPGEGALPADVDKWLPDMRRVPRAELSPAALDAFSVERVAEMDPALHGCVIWDTPDFDSVSAVTYQRGLLEVLALADVYVLVLSKEKYADLSAWKLLRLIAHLDRPMILCLNKLTADAADVVPAALRSRLAELTPRLANAPIEPIQYVHLPDAERAAHMQRAAGGMRARLSSLLAEPRKRVEDKRHDASRLLRANWDAWVAPLEAEHAAQQAWRAEVRAAGEDFLRAYRQDFLDDPKRYDSFRRATAELLQLLEIPGFSKVVGGVRQIVSWPVRKLIGAGRELMARRRESGNRGGEESLLLTAMEQMLLRLRRVAARNEREAEPAGMTPRPTRNLQAPIWRAIHARMEQTHLALQQEFASAIEHHIAATAQEIHRTADELYHTLQKHPAALNTLRAARASADLGGILIAIKTGGAHLHDLVIAPAMLALTSLMTEGALGSYMGHIAAELKERLYARVRTNLIEAVMVQRLERVTDELQSGEIIGLPPEELESAAQIVQNWEQAA